MKYPSLLVLSVTVTFLAILWVNDSQAESPISTLSLRTAHPVSVVEADIYVNRAQTTMRLKCFAEDLELLQGVEALENGFYDSDELLDA
ncbi:hypothetical protein N9Z11_03515, partial [Mariniblastus sp.]|nr:hypothetical protein [Mariniblastus sp.]